jgi:hypothetical protein
MTKEIEAILAVHGSALKQWEKSFLLEANNNGSMDSTETLLLNQLKDRYPVMTPEEAAARRLELLFQRVWDLESGSDEIIRRIEALEDLTTRPKRLRCKTEGLLAAILAVFLAEDNRWMGTQEIVTKAIKRLDGRAVYNTVTNYVGERHQIYEVRGGARNSHGVRIRCEYRLKEEYFSGKVKAQIKKKEGGGFILY